MKRKLAVGLVILVGAAAGYVWLVLWVDARESQIFIEAENRYWRSPSES